MLSPESSSLLPSVERLSVEEIAPTARRRSTENFRVVDAAPRLPPDVPAPDEKRQVIVAIEVAKTLGLVFSSKALLLLSLIGSFVLALESMKEQTTSSLLVLVAFSVATILPTTFLEIRRRQ